MIYCSQMTRERKTPSIALPVRRMLKAVDTIEGYCLETF